MRLFLNRTSCYFLLFYLFSALQLHGEAEKAVPTQREVHHKIDTMLELHVKPNKTEEDIVKIRTLQQELESYECPSSYIEQFGEQRTYDGSDASLVTTVAYAGYGRDGFVGVPEEKRRGLGAYGLPVPILRKAPGLVTSILPVFGSLKDGGIVHVDVYDEKGELRDKSFPQKIFDDYLEATKPAYGGCLNGTSKSYCGSIYRLYWIAQYRIYGVAIAVPHLLAKVPTKKLPYAVWSTKNAYNKRIFERIKPLFYKAKEAITQHWMRKGCKRAEAEDYALRALYHVPFFTTYNYKGSGLLDPTQR